MPTAKPDDPNAGSDNANPERKGDSGGPSEPSRKQHRRWVRRLRMAGIVALVMAVLGGAGMGGAEYYTAQPNFCGSCHVMDPYYESWQSDKHGALLDVRCVDCHYAPGEHHTFMAKFRGLSQAASYFSGRSGASRPRAHVADASCLTSKCHGNADHMTKELFIGERRTETRVVGGQEVLVERRPTVRFYHGKHLEVTDRLKGTEEAIEAIEARLRERMGGAASARVAETAKSVQPAHARRTRMQLLIAELGAADHAADAGELMRLEHTRLRLRQLEGLTCAACHTYDAEGDRHFSVNRGTCYTCHFTNQAFNDATGSCLTCHEAPVRKIVVHDAADASGGPTTSAATLMDHRDIVARGIDCASCHLDVIQGAASVTARDCTHCHDQERYLRDFATRTTATVEEYHRIHVAAQHARCTDCHRMVRHQLVAPAEVATSGAFLEPIVDDCKHCHPDHHREQVQLLMGVGGDGTARPMPNAMFGSRLNCRACHTKPGSDFKGGPLIEATEATCVACHSDDYERLFEQWRNEIAGYLKEAEDALERVDARVKALTESGEAVPSEIREKVRRARHNIRLVGAGNGIHNKNYALQLLDLAVRDLDAVVVRLTGD